MATPKVRMMRDDELDSQIQIETRIRLLQAELVKNPSEPKAPIMKRLKDLKARLTPTGVQPAVPAILLCSKSDVSEWGDCRPKSLLQTALA